MSKRLVSIVLPVCNDAAYLRDVVESYVTILASLPIPHELILVTNGCSDESPAIARALAQQHESVRTIDLERGSWGLAVKTGLSQAHGDVLCYTNLPRTRPEDLLLLLFYAAAYPNVIVKANRKIRENWRRRLGSLIYNLECRALFDLSYWDINGTPKIFPRTISRLLTLTREDDLIDLEFNIICRQENHPMIEVPILSYRRRGGKSTTNYQSAIRLYWGAYQMWRHEKRKRENIGA